MGITFSGISSGIDTGAIVESFVQAERSSIRNMEKQKSSYDKQLAAIRNLNSKMQSLQTTLEGMSEVGDFLSYAATYGKEEALTAVADGEASPGTYDVKVVRLAQAQRSYSQEYAEKDAAGVVGTGTLSITVGSEDTASIEIDAADTLEDIVNKINGSDAKVNASLLYTGSSYRLQVTGTETGAANAVSFGETGSLDFRFLEYKSAQDAAIEVDGHVITNDTNAIESAIPGVTLNLKEVTDQAFQLDVKADTGKIEEKVQKFVSEYNSIMSLVKNDTTSNSTLRALQMQFSMQIASEIGDVGGSYRALSEIGIKTQNDGSLKLDTDDLSEALAKDTRGVAKLFTGSDDSTVSGLGTIMDAFIERYVSSVDGVLRAQEGGLEKMISRIESSILREEERISGYEDGLVSKFTAMEIQMSQLQSQMNYMQSFSM